MNAVAENVYAKELMTYKWKRLESLFRESNEWRLQNRDKHVFDNWSKLPVVATPPFAWIERLDGTDASLKLREYGISHEAGSAHGASKEFARIALMQRFDDFDTLLNALQENIT